MTATPSTPATLGERANAVRLNPFAAQRVFGLLLDSLARPGTLARLEVPPGVPPALLPAVALADVEVPLTILDGETGWAEPVYAVTGAPPAPLAGADMVVALQPLASAEVATLRRGTPDAPERGARLVMAVERLAVGFDVAAGADAAANADRDADALRLTLSGPGVPDERTVAVTGTDHAVVAALREANREFPTGIDVHLVATDGSVVSIPRSATIGISGATVPTAGRPGHDTRTHEDERKVS